MRNFKFTYLLFALIIVLPVILIVVFAIVPLTNSANNNNLNNNSKNQYLTIFETNGGTNVESIYGTIDYSPVTTKANYTFVAWCKDSTLNQEISFPFTPTSNTTLYAKWTNSVSEIERITLNKTSACVYPGINLILTATIQPSNATNKNLTWTSSNNSVACVSNGTVVYSGNGSTVITCTANNGISASCIVRSGELVTLGVQTSGNLIRDDGVYGQYSRLMWTKAGNMGNGDAYGSLTWNFVQTTGSVSRGGLYIIVRNSAGKVYKEIWYQLGIITPNTNISCNKELILPCDDFYTVYLGSNGKWFTY